VSSLLTCQLVINRQGTYLELIDNRKSACRKPDKIIADNYPKQAHNQKMKRLQRSQQSNLSGISPVQFTLAPPTPPPRFYENKHVTSLAIIENSNMNKLQTAIETFSTL
jgi:hypothetical protein